MEVNKAKIRYPFEFSQTISGGQAKKLRIGPGHGTSENAMQLFVPFSITNAIPIEVLVEVKHFIYYFALHLNNFFKIFPLCAATRARRLASVACARLA